MTRPPPIFTASAPGRSARRKDAAALAASSGDWQARIGQASIEELIRRRVALLLDRLEEGPVTDLYGLVVREVERGLLSLILERCGGNRGLAAEQLGLHRNTLRQTLARLGLDGAEGRRVGAAPRRRGAAAKPRGR